MTYVSGTLSLTRFGLDRCSVFAGVFLVSACNGLVPRVLSSVDKFGLYGALLNLYGVSAIILFALFAIGAIGLSGGNPEPVQRRDWVATALILAASAVPYFLFGSIAVFFGGCYLIATAPKDSPSRKISIVALALTSTLLWSNVLLRLIGIELVYLDTAMVSLFTGLDHVDNTFVSIDGSKTFIVGASCASLANISLGLILTASLTQLLDVKIDRSIVMWGLAATVGIILVNTGRMAALGYYPEHFHYLHNGDGATLFGWAIMLTTFLIVATGVYRAKEARF